MPEDASEAFWLAFSMSGTITATCHCGKTYFCTYNTEGDFDPGELANLRAKRDQDPEKYIELNDCSYVSVMTLGGRQFVEGCKCGELKKYEDFIWQWHRQILAYLRGRLNDERMVLESFQEIYDQADKAQQAYDGVKPVLCDDDD